MLRLQSGNCGVTGGNVRILGRKKGSIYSCKFIELRVQYMLVIKLERKGRETEKDWERIKCAREMV